MSEGACHLHYTFIFCSSADIRGKVKGDEIGMGIAEALGNPIFDLSLKVIGRIERRRGRDALPREPP